MSYNYFDPTKANELAKFQGQYAGIQAGNATLVGTATAPTSIYNQAGFYALQDSTTGYVTLQKLADDSLYTQQWYDQGTGTIFDFTNGGTGITSTNSTSNSTTNSTTNNVTNNTTSNTTTNSTNSSTTNSTTSNSSTYGTTSGTTSQSTTSTTSGLQTYPWGTGYVAVSPNNGVTTTTNASGATTQVDENGDQIMLDAADLQELVDAGIYDSLEEALNATLSQGYGVSDEEQAKLGIYSEEDEAKIQLMMDKYGYTRDEAIAELGNKVEPKDDNEELQNKIDNLVNSGFTYDEAIEYMEALGYEIPEDMKEEPPTYSEEDEAKIAALMQSTGCSRDEAINALGVKPVEPEKLGIIRSIGKGIGDFFKGAGKVISDGWNSFIDWIW